MKNALPYVVWATLATGCGDKAERTECSDLDLDFYDAQLEDLSDVNFQRELASRLAAASLDGQASPETLADQANILEFACASSIIAKGRSAIAATDTKKDIMWVDIDSPDYLGNRDAFALYLSEGDAYAYVDGVGDQLLTVAHEFAHNLFPKDHHSEESQAFIRAIPPDNGMLPCEGWTFIAEGTNDIIYDVHATAACAYEAFEPQKLEDLQAE